jgi:hypothetical protein
MPRNLLHRLLRYVLLVLALTPGLAKAGPTATEFEQPPALPAAQLAPSTLLSGTGFHVDSPVPTDGLMAHFTIQSDVGTFPAVSEEMLRIRVAGIPAIQELNQTSKTKVFAQALAPNAARPITAAGQMVLHPIDTVKGLPSGVGRFFSRVGLGAQKLKEAATEPEEASGAEKAANTAARTGQTARDIFGYEQERRELAKKLHVDPYTTNPVLSKQLDDFALTAFRAHVGVTTTMSVFIPGSMAITATRVVSTWVWDTPRADLIVQNEKRLEELNIPGGYIHPFMRNKAFPLSVQTAFTSNLAHLAGVNGLAGAVLLANTVTSEEQARFLTDAVGMLVKYHETQTPLTRLITQGTIIGVDKNGAIAVEAPVDYVSWTKRLSYFANRTDLKAPHRSIWVTGQLSPLAKENFKAIGWVVTENVKPLEDN